MNKHRSLLVGRSELGRTVLAGLPFSPEELIAQVQGQIIADPHYESNYCMEFDVGRVLEPAPPFRYLNHSCAPNCELILWEDEEYPDNPELCLHALTSVQRGDELTIDYGWGAAAAIPCQCGSANCRGWIVEDGQLAAVQQ